MCQYHLALSFLISGLCLLLLFLRPKLKCNRFVLNKNARWMTIGGIADRLKASDIKAKPSLVAVVFLELS